jgi:hypothetical protein
MVRATSFYTLRDLGIDLLCVKIKHMFSWRRAGIYNVFHLLETGAPNDHKFSHHFFQISHRAA